MESLARSSLTSPHVWGSSSGTAEEPLPDRFDGSFSVEYSYSVYFTHDAFAPANDTLAGALSSGGGGRVLPVLDAAVLAAWPELSAQLEEYANRHADAFLLAGEPLVLPGGELLKEQRQHVTTVLEAIHARGVDRQSYVLAIGGGALLDVAGYAAAIAHRGLRLVRMPTTVLAQADSGIGVKNGVNLFDTKNFVGTFAVPVAVVNDFTLLTTLSDQDWCSGVSEAVKVAALADADFFAELERVATALVERDLDTMAHVIRRSAQMHMTHIVDRGDPFESKSARPLDFGHWSAHKLEQISDPRLRHGEAVAIGIALDCTYARLAGMLAESDWERVIALLRALRLPIDATELDDPRLLDGLRDFREHLGGELTISLIEAIGGRVDVHEMDQRLILEAVQLLHSLDGQGG